MRDYMQGANADVLPMITIEHIDALRNIAEIVEAKGGDVAIIGPFLQKGVASALQGINRR